MRDSLADREASIVSLNSYCSSILHEENPRILRLLPNSLVELPRDQTAAVALDLQRRLLLHRMQDDCP